MQNRSRVNKYTKYLQKLKMKNSIAMNLKCCYVDMHVDDFLEMANDLGYLKDDSDLNEKTFMNVMYSIECTLKDPKYKIRDPLE